MPGHQLDKPNNVYGEFSRGKGRVTFKTSDSAMLQRLKTDRDAGRTSTVCLIAAEADAEFTGVLESVELVKADRPQQWEVVMIQQGATPRKRK